MSFSLSFEITFVDGLKPNANLNLLSIFERLVFRTLGNDLKCGKCLARIFSHIDFANSYFLQLDILTTEFCSDDVLLKRIRKLAGKEKVYSRLKLGFPNETKIELELKFEKNFYGNAALKLLINKRYHLCYPPKMIDSTIFQHCPRIMISKEEAGELGLDMPSLMENKTGIEYLPVCLDNYFSKYRSKSGASTFENDWRVCLITSGNMFFLLIIFVNNY